MSDSDSTEVSPTAPDAPVSDRYDIPNPTPFKESVAYTRTWVTEDLHPAFVDPGVRYDTNTDCFAAEPEEVYDEAALFDSQKAFADALQRFQEGIKPKYKSRVDLGAVHTWKEVMDYANEARNKYTGVQKRGIMKKIDHRLKTFQTAAPAIQAWLKLLPSTSIYGSVVCGGLTIILEAAVRLRQLRKETLNALDQMPLCIENAQHLIRTYGYPQVHQHVGRLYMAIMDALQHILEWYVRAAGLRYFDSFWRGPAYAEKLKNKMANVEIASQAMDERGIQSGQLWLKEIRDVTVHTKDEVGELKILAIEARNHLYAVLKDTEIWQEALQSWRESRLAKEARRASRDQAMMEEEEENATARRSLLAQLGPNDDDPCRDMEIVLSHVTSMTLGDQDRIGAVIEHQAVQEWLLDPLFGALLVHGNGRRHDPISPTAVACALLNHVFAKTLGFPTLYWFCGLHCSGPRGNPLGMLRSLVRQLLCLSCCRCSSDDQTGLDTQHVGKLLKLFRKLLRRSSSGAGGPVICIIDGISYYESRHQRDDTCRIIHELASIAGSSSPPQLILLLTSPTRTTHISRQPGVEQTLAVTEVPEHFSGAKQSLNSRQIMSSTEKRARKLSESLEKR